MPTTRRAGRCLQGDSLSSMETRSRPGTAEAAVKTDRHGDVCDASPRDRVAFLKPHSRGLPCSTSLSCRQGFSSRASINASAGLQLYNHCHRSVPRTTAGSVPPDYMRMIWRSYYLRTDIGCLADVATYKVLAWGCMLSIYCYAIMTGSRFFHILNN